MKKEGGMKKEERRTVASAIVKKSRRLSLEELAARGKRHVRVLTAGEAFDEIESVVDETSTKRANEIAGREGAWVFEEAKEQFARAARLRTDSERLVREQTNAVRQDADRVAALERKLKDELQELKSSVKALEEKSTSPDPGQLEALLGELSRREEANRSELEARLETTMSATIDAVRKTVVAALKGTGDTSVDATSLIVSKVLDDQAGALESNVAGIEVTETRVADTAGGVRANLARLKQLRGGSATAPSASAEAPERRSSRGVRRGGQSARERSGGRGRRRGRREGADDGRTRERVDGVDRRFEQEENSCAEEGGQSEEGRQEEDRRAEAARSGREEQEHQEEVEPRRRRSMSSDFDRIPTETVGRNRLGDLSETDLSNAGGTDPLGAELVSTGAPSETGVAVGKGLDVGTANLLSAVMGDDGETVVRRERNMFLEIPREFQRNRSMLTKLNVPYVTYQDRVFVIGNSSFELANMFGKDVRRPMKDGFLSSQERDAIALLRFLIERLLGEPVVENEPRPLLHSGSFGGHGERHGLPRRRHLRRAEEARLSAEADQRGACRRLLRVGRAGLHGGGNLLRRRHVQRLRRVSVDSWRDVLGRPRW